MQDAWATEYAARPTNRWIHPDNTVYRHVSQKLVPGHEGLSAPPQQLSPAFQQHRIYVQIIKNQWRMSLKQKLSWTLPPEFPAKNPTIASHQQQWQRRAARSVKLSSTSTNNFIETIALFKRFSATYIAIILLVACLSIFSGLGTLGRWEQRGFNTLAILFTGIMSLGLG